MAAAPPQSLKEAMPRLIECKQVVDTSSPEGESVAVVGRYATGTIYIAFKVPVSKAQDIRDEQQAYYSHQDVGEDAAQWSVEPWPKD